MWLLAAAFAALQPACGCSPVHPAERIYAAELVFTARVHRSVWPNVEYTVLARHKGKAPSRIMIYDLSHACGAPQPKPGAEYLVLARRSAGLWVSGPCDDTLPAERAQHYVQHLGTKPGANLITGQVVFPSRLRTSALVRLRRGSTIYYATADEAGLFALPDLPSGEYSVEAVAAGFTAVKTPVVNVPAKGVARVYVAMEPQKARRR
jgi:hypothetical protein